jgi:hypothetical protein
MVSGNTIDCGAGLHYCDFGLMLGARPWGGCWGPNTADCSASVPSSPGSMAPQTTITAILPNPDTCSYNIYGGTVTGNTVMNAKQGINVDGGGASPKVFIANDPNCPNGSPGYPITVYGNVVSGSILGMPTQAVFSCNPAVDDGQRLLTEEINISDFYNYVDRNGEAQPVSPNTYNPVLPTPPMQPNSLSFYCP